MEFVVWLVVSLNGELKLIEQNSRFESMAECVEYIKGPNEGFKLIHGDYEQGFFSCKPTHTRAGDSNE